MVEDSEIKTEVSPFAIRQGEVKTFDGLKTGVGVNVQRIPGVTDRPPESFSV